MGDVYRNLKRALCCVVFTLGNATGAVRAEPALERAEVVLSASDGSGTVLAVALASSTTVMRARSNVCVRLEAAPACGQVLLLSVDLKVVQGEVELAVATGQGEVYLRQLSLCGGDRHCAGVGGATDLALVRLQLLLEQLVFTHVQLWQARGRQGSAESTVDTQVQGQETRPAKPSVVRSSEVRRRAFEPLDEQPEGAEPVSVSLSYRLRRWGQTQWLHGMGLGAAYRQELEIGKLAVRGEVLYLSSLETSDGRGVQLRGLAGTLMMSWGPRGVRWRNTQASFVGGVGWSYVGARLAGSPGDDGLRHENSAAARLSMRLGASYAVDWGPFESEVGVVLDTTPAVARYGIAREGGFEVVERSRRLQAELVVRTGFGF